MDERSTSMSLPLDNDGFLRRECPTCEREFKWQPSDESDPAEPGGYFCPYCAIQAPEDHWWTKPQLELAQQITMRELADPMMRDFARRVGATYESNVSDAEPQELVEGDDMRRVDFPCHPAEPLKVLDEWTEPVHCLICGTPASA